jgi:hypothetical protein
LLEEVVTGEIFIGFKLNFADPIKLLLTGAIAVKFSVLTVVGRVCPVED